MISVKLLGHDYRYELFQIISLFYDKSQIVFEESHKDCIFESVLNTEESLAKFIIFNEDNEKIEESLKVDLTDKKSIKNSIKMTALKCLEKYTGVNIPWGILVGIRPTKIAHECFKKGLSNEETLRYLMSNYSLSLEKAFLTVEVARNEAKFLSKQDKAVSVYIGIPFCPSRCVYCSFTSNTVGSNKTVVDDYLTAMLREVDASISYLVNSGFKVDTLYIGGGTPTSLSSNQLYKLFDHISKYINLDELREFTVEAGRPDSFDRDKLLAIKHSGCTRISINPQTMNDKTLKRVGRMHTSKDVVDKYYLAREIGFDNINMDVIIGLPGEGEKEVEATMKSIRNLSPENITIHTMAIKRASILNEREYSRENNAAEGMYSIATNIVREMGMYPYYMYRQKNMVSPLENIGYCKKDRECIYNIQMIAENISIISIGADAVSKFVFEKENRIERVANLKDIKEYINRIDEIINKKIQAINMII